MTTRWRRKMEALYAEIHPPARDAAILAGHDALRSLSEILPGTRCLDAGCGATGRAMQRLRELGAAVVVGCDLPSVVRAAPDDPLKVAADLEVLPFRSQSFDVVYCNGVLHHTRNPPALLRECARILRRGGVLYLAVYGRGGLVSWAITVARCGVRCLPRRLIDWWLRDAMPLWRANILDVLYVPILRRFSTQGLWALLTAQGFQNLQRVETAWTYPRGVAHWLQASAWPTDLPGRRLLHGAGWIAVRATRS